MRAKTVNEERMVHEPYPDEMAFQIAQTVETIYNGDDVDYEPNKEDIEQLENIIEETVKEGLLYLDEVDEEEDNLELFSDPNWIMHNIPKNEVRELYRKLVEVGFINDDEFDEEKMREDLYDPQDDYGKFQSRQPGDNFDLDQDIYDRNQDYDVDENLI